MDEDNTVIRPVHTQRRKSERNKKQFFVNNNFDSVNISLYGVSYDSKAP